MTALPWPLRALVLAVLVLLYYKYAKAALFAACRRAAHLLPFARRWDASERGGVLELAAAGASHVLVVLLLALVTGVDIAALLTGWNRPGLIVLGAAIGVGEVALGSLLCRVVIEGVQARGRRRAATERGGARGPSAGRGTVGTPAGRGPAGAPFGRGPGGAVGASFGRGPGGAAGAPPGRAAARTLPATTGVAGPAADAGAGEERMRQWLGLSRGGWIRHHLKTMEVVSLPLALTLTAVQVGSEEVVFRGLALTWLRDAGPVLAIALSCLLFTVMQVFLMSSWRAAMFPVVGAIVMGLTHSVLYWNYPILIPLMVAHVTFFLFAVA
ncbi:hypothetical protein Sme01_50800 [Sphaerisporangium melleum]|uniref:CAAX prenyl protease 2/Lysostaphin resistance protein A-like domain-containing protein n=1 Tax=Sphaerisporangium melleum TaxID=321316 RepID=A0A917QX76_9ACTN|nr:CPBP family intramembrane glutamic endopeptidase [Sphaerisporangium melleum]GGK75201.1 hypothetical protein GCM10007964_17550 [Sphaerisporangium melleum]GII72604.1 hypothetical protein Sme01_50800 [Sphaerisporangium melleum]